MKRQPKHGVCDEPGCGRARHTKNDKKCSSHVAGGRRNGAQRNGNRRGGTGKSTALQSLTEVEWDAIWTAQGGCCPLCGKPLKNRYFPEKNAPNAKVAACDHDHILEKLVGTKASVRGLLCSMPCNKMLTYHFTEEFTLKVLVYIRDIPAQAVLSKIAA